MAYHVGRYPIAEKQILADGFYSFTVECPELATDALPGQFVNIRVPEFSLRRPISICEIDKEAGTLRLVFQIRGEGTKVLAELEQGDLIDLLGPLGNSFTIDSNKKAVVIGGGIGVPPMLELAKQFHGSATAILGFRCSDTVILEDDFRANTSKTLLYCDDGSTGTKGFVTDGLSALLAAEKPEMIYACGPDVMLRRIIDIAKRENIPCEVSLEQRMACGVGACYVCACRLIKNGEEYYGHVCKDGPIFNANQVKFED